MANEADFLNVSELDNRQVTWGSSSTVLKGTLVILTKDPNTGDIHRGSADSIPLGFAVHEKTSDEDNTTIGVKVRGDVDAVADGSITIGRLVVPGGTTANRVQEAPTSLSGVGLAYVLGRCLETASSAEKVRIRLMLG